jgi:Arc/MetJ-type ribon-helix-helix transcriptional regulator
MPTTNVQILLKITTDLEKKIEEAIRKGGYRSRQEFILEAVRNSLKRERI